MMSDLIVSNVLNEATGDLSFMFLVVVRLVIEILVTALTIGFMR